MAFLKIDNVAIRGLAACVPPRVDENIDLPFYANKEEAMQVIQATGIERRHVATPDIAVSDLSLKAAEKLIADLGWEKDSIDLLALVTQNPDYPNHPTSFVVHEHLGLPESTMCIDYFHGCPGWVVSLSSVAAMLCAGNIKRAILLDCDTITKDQSAADREGLPLFGDAAVATALEYDENAAPMLFNIGTKSEDGRALARENGGYRRPFTIETLQNRLDVLSGVKPAEQDSDHMDAMDVFSFAITKVPKAIKKLCAEYDIELDDVDNLVLHQANKLIIDAIAKRMKMPAEKVVNGLKNYGNTTSASVPLAMVTERADALRSGKQRSLVCGFGTGLSWGAAYLTTENLVIPEVIIY